MKTHTTTKEQIEENKNRKSGLQRHGIVKILSLFICIALLLATLAACGNGEENGSGAAADDPTETTDDTLFGAGDNDDSSGEEPGNDTADPPRDYSARLAANLEESMTTFDRDAVMISAGDQHVTWAELYVFLFSTVANFTGFFEAPVDWSEEVIGERTMAEMVLEMATENALAFLSYRYGAAELGTSLSQEEIEELNFELQSIIDFHGGPEEFSVVLRENHGFYDFEVFFEIMMTETLVDAILNDLYGDFGADLPDEVAIEFAERNDYMMAKHILVMRADNENARNEIDEIYNRLRPRADDADFENFFSLMMLEYSEDPGSHANPGGYLFQPWDMVEPFSTATMQLLPGEMSDVVETGHGYHIILRIPIDLDAVPISLLGQGIMNTIRQIAAADDFELLATQWREQMNPEFSALYDSIDLANVFAWLEE